MPDLKDLLQDMRARDASDLHLRVGMSPIYRINGVLIRSDSPVMRTEEMEVLLGRVLTGAQREMFERNKEFDTALDYSDVGRYRVNVYRQRNDIAMVFRAIKSEVLDFAGLNLPPVLSELALRRRGLILVTGTAGSGKSTTLAAMIEHINHSENVNIVTIEDPIEFIYENNKSIIAQREVGNDTHSFPDALKHILRQDPNVILIGEIRDVETMTVALNAADSGHLVLSTLHTIDAAQTVSRVISFFPLDQQQYVRLLFSGTLQAIISMRLLPRADSKGRIPAVEVLVGTGTVRDCLLEPEKSQLIPQLIEDGVTEYGMQSFDQSLLQLYQRGMITLDVARKFSTSPTDFELKVAGVVGASDRSMRFFDQQGDTKEEPPQESGPQEPSEGT
ncbi:MAG: hypothetical protein AMJ92_08865 [candidate division Zixibacteria bacterium SM23_81]|nr:MAG: hypothetical protein AMJ92_08865 [candidate division Zixibacteria bacterium SM23_81]